MKRFQNLAGWEPHFKVSDHLGSTRVSYKLNGIVPEITALYDYEPFGKPRPLALAGGATGEERLAYIGKEKDQESNLGDHGVRKYDYETGRFTSTDVLWEKYAGWSPYHYCGNNPISRVDWNGKLITDSKGNYLFIPISVPEELTHPSGDQALMIRGIMFANNGTPIEAFENVSNKDGWDSDCHGTTFAGGQYWINNDQVDRILTGDKFKKDPKKSKIGDKVVYYGPDGKPVHSMTISNISPDKKITVKGEGGLESELKEMSIEDAWYPGSEYHIFRPTSKNKKVSNELIKKITNEVCNQVEEN